MDIQIQKTHYLIPRKYWGWIAGGIVLVGVLVDLAVQTSSGVQFNAVTGSICLWFIASEGVSVVENAAELGVPIPGILRRALEVLKDGSGDGEDKTE